MGKREDEWRARLEHAVHLSEDPADVADVVERPRAEREVDLPRREEREIGGQRMFGVASGGEFFAMAPADSLKEFA